MKQVTQSSFNEGLLMDMNPLVTPQTCLTDCLNGTLVTFNGNEFTLQNDSGNVAIEGGILPNGFIPVGMKEYGGIIYTALLNPVTNMCQIGSIPSPDYSKQPKDQSKEGVTISFDGDDTFNNMGTETTGYEFKNKIIKLFEFDQMVLNPGDKYKIVYQVLPGNKDISKIYNVNWLAIDESGKEYTLKSPSIDKIGNGDFKYFNQTIKAVLALEITLNNIDWFEISAYSLKNNNNAFDINLHLYGKNKIKWSNEIDDDLYIRGCKIEIPYKDQTITEYVWDETLKNLIDENKLTESKLSDTFELKNVRPNITFPENEEVNIYVTPFDQFRMIDELKRKVFVKTGQVQVIDGFNDLFQYKYSSSNKSLRLDFNANLRGIDDARVYLEFYDLWSDYSVIIPVNDPNPFGKNSVFISTSSEKCTKDFSDTRGGIDPRQLVKSEELIYISTLTGDEKLIRSNQILRENNLYIVKISVIENSSNPKLIKYNNVYKVFTLNENMNDIYEEYQLSENPLFKDFSILSQGTGSVKVNYTIDDIVNNSPVIISGEPTILNTDGYYYVLSTSDLSNIPAQQKCVKTITKNRKYTFGLSIDSSKLPYGLIEGFTLNNDLTMSHINENIVETDETVNSTRSEVTNPIVTNNKITINNILTTTREITATVQKENRTVRSMLDKKSVWDTLVKGYNDSPSGYIRQWGGDSDHPRRIVLGSSGDENNIIVSHDRVSGNSVNEYFNSSRVLDSVKDNGKLSSGGILYWNNTPENYVDVFGGKHKKFCISKIESSGSIIPTHINNFLICLLNDDKSYYPVFTNDVNSAIDVLKNIFTSNVAQIEYRLYYYGELVTNKESTSYTKPEFLLSGTSKINFVQYIHLAKNDFSQGNILNKINTIIAESDPGASISLESNRYLQVINESNNINFDIKLNELEITDGVDKTILNKLVTSKSDLEFNEASKLINSTLTNQKPYSTNYPNIANKFDVSYSLVNGKLYPRFKYKHSNLKISLWAVQGDGDKNDRLGYKIDTSIFEL